MHRDEPVVAAYRRSTSAQEIAELRLGKTEELSAQVEKLAPARPLRLRHAAGAVHRHESISHRPYGWQREWPPEELD